MARPIELPNAGALADCVGRDLGTSDWVEVSQARIDAFAEATGDRQWIHCDAERAQRESPFKATVAHGYLTLSLVPVLLAQLLVVGGDGTVINAGVEKLRLSAPVPSGSRIRLSATIRDTRKLPRGGVRVAFEIRIDVEGAAKPACHGEITYVYL